MTIKNNKDPMKSKYIVIGDPKFVEPTVWGFNSLKDAKDVYTQYVNSREDVILAQVIERKGY